MGVGGRACWRCPDSLSLLHLVADEACEHARAADARVAVRRAGNGFRAAGHRHERQGQAGRAVDRDAAAAERAPQAALEAGDGHAVAARAVAVRDVDRVAGVDRDLDARHSAGRRADRGDRHLVRRKRDGRRRAAPQLGPRPVAGQALDDGFAAVFGVDVGDYRSGVGLRGGRRRGGVGGGAGGGRRGAVVRRRRFLVALFVGRIVRICLRPGKGRGEGRLGGPLKVPPRRGPQPRPGRRARCAASHRPPTPPPPHPTTPCSHH